MKRVLFSLLFVLFVSYGYGQTRMLVEKMGSRSKYYFFAGDRIKLKITPFDTILKGRVWSIGDSLISVSRFGINDLKIRNIGSVYKEFSFPKKLAKKTAIFGGVIFLVIMTNHLINNEKVFTPDLFIISGASLGVSLISFSFSQRQCRIGPRWKIKILDFSVFR
ncbi:MAG: hypothetical protein WCL00_02980 [Bacteroidota bacterium]